MHHCNAILHITTPEKACVAHRLQLLPGSLRSMTINLEVQKYKLNKVEGQKFHLQRGGRSTAGCKILGGGCDPAWAVHTVNEYHAP